MRAKVEGLAEKGEEDDDVVKEKKGPKIKRVSLTERVKMVKEMNVEELLLGIENAVKSDPSQKDEAVA